MLFPIHWEYTGNKPVYDTVYYTQCDTIAAKHYITS